MEKIEIPKNIVARLHTIKIMKQHDGEPVEVVGEGPMLVFRKDEYYKDNRVDSYYEDEAGFVVRNCNSCSEFYKRTTERWTCDSCMAAYRQEKMLNEAKEAEAKKFEQRVTRFAEVARERYPSYGIRKSRKSKKCGGTSIDITLPTLPWEKGVGRNECHRMNEVRKLALEFNLKCSFPARIESTNDWSRYRLRLVDINPFAKEFFREFE